MREVSDIGSERTVDRVPSALRSECGGAPFLGEPLAGVPVTSVVVAYRAVLTASRHYPLR